MDKATDLRRKCRHFRILVIGRANSGKTTLLKKVCNSVEDPEIFDPSGKKVRATYHLRTRRVRPLIPMRSIAARSHRSARVIGGTNHNPIQVHSRLLFSQRGLHDINNQLVFKSNPQFIFHDSRGFESGSLSENETVDTFITERVESTDLPSQLHAIWCGINDMIFRRAQRINCRYCLPTDTNRPLLDADRDFFSKYGGGKSQWAYLFLHINLLSFSAPY